MDAESAYLFRHALLRDAAYQLQPPQARADLHALVVRVFEDLHGEPPAPGFLPEHAYRPHAIDRFAAELALHAEAAGTHELRQRRRLYLQRAAEHAETQYQSAEAAGLWLTLAKLLRGEPRGDCTRRAALAAHKAGRPDQAQAHLTRMLAHARRLRSPRLTALALSGNAVLAYQLGDIARANRLYRATRKAAKAADDRLLEANTLGNLALLMQETGRLQDARAFYDQSLAMLDAANQRAARAAVLGNLVALHLVEKRFHEAHETYQHALSIQREFKDRRGEGATLISLAITLSQLGRSAEVEPMYLRALAILREVGNRFHEGVVIGNLGIVRLQSGQLAQADQLLAQAVALHRDTGNRRFEGVHQRFRAFALLERGQQEKAQECWREGEQILQQIGDTAELINGREQLRITCTKVGIKPFEPVQ